MDVKDAFPPRLLIKMPQQVGADLERRPFGLEGTTFRLRPLCPNEATTAALGAAASPRWYLAEASPAAVSSADLWELAYKAVSERGMASALGLYAEPDFLHPWPYENPVRSKKGGFGAAPGETCEFNDQNGDYPLGPGFAWHLGGEFSQLKVARDEVNGDHPGPVRIGILDTGFDFSHHAKPIILRLDLQRNFVDDGQPADDASDPFERGLFNNPGHGTGTIGILAGGKIATIGDFLGGAPLAEIIPVRIATSVILMATSAFVEAVDYLIAPNGDGALRPDVVSMSMGGVASRAWAEVVNRAYDAGICLVTAAGNNKLGSPQSIVYPARFRRVIAACGIMADRRPYIRANVKFGRMAGNFGPDSKMDTALAAFTPNTPWAEINCPGIIDMDGSGTSSATPQIAAAAALWLQKHKSNLSYNEPWMIIEAVRRALFASADKSLPDFRTFLGQGVLQAARVLEEQPAAAQELVKTPEDRASFPILHILTGQGIAPPAPLEMLEVEALQLLQRDEEIEHTIADPDLPAAEVPAKEIKRFLEAAMASEHASATLRSYLERIYTNQFAGPELRALPDKSRPYGMTEGEVPLTKPTCRRLRGYAFDPDMATRLEATDISQIVFDVRWEDDLRPGPVGEYLEVIDYDPASGGFYAPVDLDDPSLLAADGLPPAESNPNPSSAIRAME